jgi:hypothetical protein
VAEEAIEAAAYAVIPGRFIVDLLPFGNLRLLKILISMITQI